VAPAVAERALDRFHVGLGPAPPVGQEVDG
jgi:hypothetical protein